MRFHPIFTSHMVFPAHRPLFVFGEGRGTVEIRFVEQTRRVSCENGRWEVEFPPMEYGGPYPLTAIAAEETVTLEDVCVGEVYLMAGQSNMQFKLKESTFPPQEWESNPFLRLYVAPRPEDGEPFGPADGWTVCSAEQAGQWSALAYHVGQLRAAKKKIAIGVIGCYQGASVIESWVPEGTFAAEGIALTAEEKYGDHFHEKYGRWNRDGFLYRHALSPLVPFPLSAVVWYQGESDVSLAESEVYETELGALIRVWRRDFRNAGLPFVVVQLADYVNRAGPAWCNVQQAQARISQYTESVRTAICADVCEKNNIHPPTKIKLAQRIADALDELL